MRQMTKRANRVALRAVLMAASVATGSLLTGVGALSTTSLIAARAQARAQNPAGSGYWLVTADGQVLNYGVPSYGDLAGHHLNAPIVGITPTPDGQGYWLIGADGGVFSFGDASFYGSHGANPVSSPVVAGAAAPFSSGGSQAATGATGPQGPAGPAGPTGATGAQGAPGPSDVVSSTLHFAAPNVSVLPVLAAANLTLTLLCATNDTLEVQIATSDAQGGGVVANGNVGGKVAFTLSPGVPTTLETLQGGSTSVYSRGSFNAYTNSGDVLNGSWYDALLNESGTAVCSYDATAQFAQPVP